MAATTTATTFERMCTCFVLYTFVVECEESEKEEKEEEETLADP